MRLNRDVLLQGIIKHQSTFFKLLDYIDKNDGTLEFPEHLYINLYNTEICNDDTNTQIHLSTQSLLENGIFIHNDKHSGMITIERIIVELLRFLDIKRAKELTQFDFERLRKRTADITQEMLVLTPHSQEFLDAKSAFNDLMSEIHSRIKENVTTLTAQVDSVARDYKLYDSGSSSISLDDLYQQITTLYSRYVLPCYEFINPDMEMVGTTSFSKSLQQLIKHYSDRNTKQYDIANTLQYRKAAITSYFKNLSVLVRKLEQFSTHLEYERDYFLAIESAYSELMDNIIPLRHGKQRNKYLSPNADSLSKLNSLDGLSTIKSRYSSNFNWDNETTALRFKEYLHLLNTTPTKRQQLKPLPSTINFDQDRQILISKILINQKSPVNILDIHLYIYQVLKNNLDDFTLSDVLYGLESYIPILNQKNIASKNTYNRLEDKTHFLNYLELELREETINV